MVRGPPQPKLQRTTSVMIEGKAVKEIVALADEKQLDEYELVLTQAKKAGNATLKGPLTNDEITRSKSTWVQQEIPEDRESSGWSLGKDKETEILRCVGRIQVCSPLYVENERAVRQETYSSCSRTDITNGSCLYHWCYSRRMVDSSFEVVSKENDK